MQRKQIEYTSSGKTFVGDLILPEGDEPHPCLMLFPAWKGKDSFIQGKAEEIVSTLGVGTFVADMYGEGLCVETNEEAETLMMPLFLDRKELRARAQKAFEVVAAEPLVQEKKIGACGFCFGGLVVIELFKSKTPLLGGCAFHPVLGNALGGKEASLVPAETPVTGSLLVLVGDLDPLVSDNDLLTFQQEMRSLEADWQLHLYGGCYHAFTNPQVKDKEAGLVYDPVAQRRSFQAMGNFFSSLI